MKYYILLPVGFILFSIACRNTPPPTPAKKVGFNELPEDFRNFYQKFHTDSAYQMAHISWPLRGETAVQSDSTYPERRLKAWEPADWQVQHLVDLTTGEFRGEWEITGNTFVLERIKYAAATYGVERHFFKRDDGEWELMYYADMQDLGQ